MKAKKFKTLTEPNHYTKNYLGKKGPYFFRRDAKFGWNVKMLVLLDYREISKRDKMESPVNERQHTGYRLSISSICFVWMDGDTVYYKQCCITEKCFARVEKII